MTKATAALALAALVLAGYGAWLVPAGFRMNHAQTVAADGLTVTVGEVVGQSRRYVTTTDTVYLPALDRHAEVAPRADDAEPVGPVRRVEFDRDDPAVARYAGQDAGRTPGWPPVAVGAGAILLGVVLAGAAVRRLLLESDVRVVDEAERLRLRRAIASRHGGAG